MLSLDYNKPVVKSIKRNAPTPKEISYWGHILNENGMETDPSKLEAIKNWPFPRNEASLVFVLQKIHR